MSRFTEVESERLKIALDAAERYQVREYQREAVEKHGVAGVEDAELLERYEQRARRLKRRFLNPKPLPEALRMERVLGRDDRHNIPKTEDERVAGMPVARIVDLTSAGGPAGYGTGFMVSPRLLLTNHHVLRNEADARISGANFGHEFIGGGVLNEGQIFDLLPDVFFYNNRPLDFALVAVADQSGSGKSLDQFGAHRLLAETGKIILKKPINIIQHPNGLHKRYATEGNDLLDRLDNFLHYESDTDPGSSGSPCFNEFWEVVALHHSSVPMMRGNQILNKKGEPWTQDQGTAAIQWIANEGIRISKILEHLASLDIESLAGSTLLKEMLQMAADDPPVDTDITTTDSAAETLVAVGDADKGHYFGDARSIVHVHGDATINTGDVITNSRPAGHIDATERSGPALLLEKKLRFDPAYDRRTGFDEWFLQGVRVELPRTDSRTEELFLDRSGNPVVLDYHHYSLTMNVGWNLMMWSASNVDYRPEVRYSKTRKDYGEDTWIHDPRIPETIQIDDDNLYAPAKKFDRGHIVRRDDSVWGATELEAEFSNADTFHWTNCSPQHEEFNRHAFGHKGVWGGLEGHIARQARTLGTRVIVFAGPVLSEQRSLVHDFGGGEYRIPLDFWKVVVVPRKQRNSIALSCFGFLMEQGNAIEEFGIERVDEFQVGKYNAVQRPVASISDLTGVLFPDAVLKGDEMGDANAASSVTLESLSDVKL